MNYATLASPELVATAVAACKKNNLIPHVVPDKQAALALIQSLIPTRASIMNGSSVTLQEIGFIDYLKSGNHDWHNLHQEILEEDDSVKRSLLRQHSVHADVYLGSAHAVAADTGTLVVASGSGSQLPHIVFTSPCVLLIVGTQKITPDLTTALDRLHTYVVPKENKRALEVYKTPAYLAKTLLLHGEAPHSKRTVHVIFVNEALGY